MYPQKGEPSGVFGLKDATMTAIIGDSEKIIMKIVNIIRRISLNVFFQFDFENSIFSWKNDFSFPEAIALVFFSNIIYRIIMTKLKNNCKIPRDAPAGKFKVFFISLKILTSRV